MHSSNRSRSLLAGSIALLAATIGPVEPWRARPPLRLDAVEVGGPTPFSAPLRLDQIQVIGSHNSYHRRPDVGLYRLVDPRAIAWDYDHPPLPAQLDAGFRAFELDVFVDDEGGRFATPLTIRGRAEDPARRAPGFQVLHVPDLDQESNCPTLAGCLQDLAAWSAAHPAHLPIVVMLECVAVTVGDRGFLDFAEAAAWERSHVAALEALVRTTIGEDGLVTPDMVRGDHATLAEAIRAKGWPAVDDLRGRILFVITSGRGSMEDLRTLFPRLAGSALFAMFDPDDPDASLVVLNDPVGEADAIARARARGLLVRTRADADLREPRRGDTTRRDAALASGANIISTDILAPRNGYSVRMPDGGVARVSPLAPVPSAGAPLDP
ncbi:MAG: hypothetical protein RI967_826 [Planctomycetota bacterium]|jgi:hypothetical protein